MEDAAKLDESAFSLDNMSVTLDCIVDVNTRFIVTRRLAEDGAPHKSGDSFFMLEKVK